jgi:hypothetical protein
MGQNSRRGGNYGPYCCLLFLLGLGFLVAGIGSGMVMNSIANLSGNSPESSESLKTLGIWSAFTFGSLGFGSLGIRYYGIRNSLLWFGIILILCGSIGLYVNYTEGGPSHSGNVIWVAMNFIAGITGSLLFTSIGAIGIGGLLVISTLLMRGDQGNANTTRGMTSGGNQAKNQGPMLTCSRCGHQNPVWFAVCEQCGAQITMGKINGPW